MKTIEEIRHARFMQIVESDQFPSLRALAEHLGRAPSQLSQWKNRFPRKGGGVHNIDSDSARHIEERMGQERGWMDHDPDLDTPRAVKEAGIGQQVATLIEGLPSDKRLKAFFINYQMCVNDIWPKDIPGLESFAWRAHQPADRPSSEPSETPEPSDRE